MAHVAMLVGTGPGIRMARATSLRSNMLLAGILFFCTVGMLLAEPESEPINPSSPDESSQEINEEGGELEPMLMADFEEQPDDASVSNEGMKEVLEEEGIQEVLEEFTLLGQDEGSEVQSRLLFPPSEGTPVNVSFHNDGMRAVQVHKLSQDGSDEPKYVGTMRESETMWEETVVGTTFELKEASDGPAVQFKIYATVRGPGSLILLEPDELGQPQFQYDGFMACEVVGQQPRLFMCEECLHSGWDYCIRTNRCVQRGEIICDGPDDHVSGDEDFAEQIGGTFLECPPDADLLDGEYIKVHGNIGTDVKTLFQEELTLKDGRSKCTATPECHGITVEQDPSSDDVPVLMFFKAASDIIHSSWVSYIFVKRADARTRSMHVPRAEVLHTSGFLKQKMRSEPVPGEGEAYSGHVRNLVGSTFNDAVQNVEKDVFVTCFAPWCGWCQQFKPTYASIAKGLRHVKTLEFTQIDATRNSVGDIEIEAYPTLLLFRAGPNKSEVLRYPGQRTPDKVKAWLHTYATHSFSDYPPTDVQSDDTEHDGLLGNEDDL